MKKIWYITILGTLSACGNPLGGKHSNIDAEHRPGEVPIPRPLPGKGIDFIAASAQMKRSNSGRYFIQTTLGSPTEQLFTKSPNLQYILISNVQGDVIATGE